MKLGSRKSGKSGKKRMLIIVNPYATTVSDRLKNLVVYALQGRFEVETVATEAQNHATEIGREVRDHGYDVVVAFGGDGTLNEVANGLAGTDMPVSVLPGGSTNVVCRTLGIPNDVVDATEHLLALADEWSPRKIDLGMVDERHFVFSCGVGHRRHRGQAGRRPPRAEVEGRALLLHLGARSRASTATTCATRSGCGSRPTRAGAAEGITALAQNSDPFTYFASRPIRVCEGVEIDDGTLSVGVLERAAQRDMPSLIPRLFSETRPGRPPPPDRALRRRHRGDHRLDLERARTAPSARSRSRSTATTSARRRELELRAEPGALTIVA